MSLNEINCNQVYDSTRLTGVIFQLADGTIQSCNVDAGRILGYTWEQLLGTSLFELPWRTIDEDSSLFLWETYPATISIATGQPCSDVIMGFYKPKGDLVWLSIDTLPLFKKDYTKPYGVEITFREVSQPIGAKISCQSLPQKRSLITDAPSVSSHWKKQLKVLLVEDCPEDREIYRRYLQTDTDYEYHFINAESGEEALALSRQYQPDIVLLDYLLPDMDGLEWLTQWQQQNLSNRPPVIALTGQGDENIAVQFTKLGAATYIVKDQITSNRLKLEVKQAIAEWQSHIQHQATLIALQHNLQFTQQITDAVPGIIYIYDAIAHKNLYLNSQTYTLLGYTPQQIFNLGVNFLPQVMHPEDLVRFKGYIEQLKTAPQEEVSNFEYRMRHQNGEWRWFSSQDRVYQRTEDGRVLQILGTAQDISDRKNLEMELVKVNNILQSVISDSSDAVVVKDLQGRYLIANQTAADWLGVTVEEMIGQDDAVLFDLETAEAIRAMDRQVLAQETIISFEEQITFPAKTRILLTNKYPWRDPKGEILGIIGHAKDITELKESQQKIQQNEQILRLALQSANAGSWDWEIETGRIIWSPENYDIYGIDPQKSSLQYQDWSKILHPEDRERLNQQVQQVVSGHLSEFNSEFRIIHPQRGVRWIWGIGKVIVDHNERPIRISGINLDITNRKLIEARLKQQTEDLIQANQLKDEFLAIVSHELRTPLNPILGWSQLISSGRITPENTLQGIGIIERNAKLQAQLIDDLLDVSRILQGKINFKQNPLNLELVIRSAISTVQLAAEAKLIEIETAFESNIGQVLGDKDRLQQVVWNLVSNAVKFTPEGGRITVTLERAGTQALIQVKDTGKGIEPEFLPYVFDRFRQAESSSTRKFGGLGLGLAIVRHLTELHGGTVTVDSPGEGQGATFSIKLPLRNTSEIEQSNGKELNQPLKSRKTSLFSGVRVLLVDDEADSLELLSFVLEQEGAEVNSVSSAQKALKAFKAFTPDLIISDIGMPEVDGYTFMTQVRQLSQGKNVPAIAVTAYAGEADKQRCFDSGYQQHIAKPINIGNLLSIITQLI